MPHAAGSPVAQLACTTRLRSLLDGLRASKGRRDALLRRCATADGESRTISPASPLHLTCISPASRLYLGRCATLDGESRTISVRRDAYGLLGFRLQDTQAGAVGVGVCSNVHTPCMHMHTHARAHPSCAWHVHCMYARRWAWSCAQSRRAPRARRPACAWATCCCR